MSADSAKITTWMYLIRHGATANNISRPPVLQGNGINGPLVEIGLRQAEETAKFLTRTPLAAIYSSPLLRAMQTAEKIAAGRELTIQTSELLKEVDVGRWEGKDWGWIEANDPEAYRLHHTSAAEHGYPEGENLKQVQARVVPELMRILDTHDRQHIAVVAHNVVIRSMIAYLLELPLDNVGHIHHDNCGITLVRRRSGQTRLISTNSIFHLTSETPRTHTGESY
ncbi:histidine phosphatase family protein [Blastopirellula sp. JC732]|uniref:Histidine phosphatase family protein n=1 Tax=Blastopirellula sediminis TaxID=2894196 RepID=A0A9X1MPL1_9BACT|nr:histidine phosphatase family protein [Blastopirellula sediminis]MCC9605687.1 histidine phosphatase family protein [Blastopirellula sediminis]MCC9631013.1 histidine phosphatase family protein [Blastopirellula sediminis]